MRDHTSCSYQKQSSENSDHSLALYHYDKANGGKDLFLVRLSEISMIGDHEQMNE